MLGVEFHKKENRDKIINRLFKKKLLVIPSGLKTIRILPPLVITPDEISKGLNIFEKVLKDLIVKTFFSHIFLVQLNRSIQCNDRCSI
ncbi:MAG: aminotransferase class III-fold pyridoxal phosphate-dependent enzyme [Nitrososphaeraceae archaeon]